MWARAAVRGARGAGRAESSDEAVIAETAARIARPVGNEPDATAPGFTADGRFAAVPRSVELYLVLIGAVVVERLIELVISARNARRALADGGVESEQRSFYGLMVAVHALFLAAAPLEVVAARRPFLPVLGWPMLALVAAAMALRYWAVRSLGTSWNTRLIVVPGEPAVVGGPYRFVRHPNYVAVVVEMFALPLVHTAWLTALLFSAANAALLAARIPREEAALRRAGDYEARLGARARFLPGPRGWR
jgi:methyltransferase